MSHIAKSDAFGDYTPDSVRVWAKIVARQEIRDRMFFPWLAQYLRPGSVLDLGAACGQTSQYLQEIGFKVVASDIKPFFVEYMKKRGLDAQHIDATNIQKSIGDRTFDNVFAQGLSSQMFKLDRSVSTRTYESVASALKPKGRFVSICGLYRKKSERSRYFNRAEHTEQIERQGLFNIIAVVPHMVAPPRLYRMWNRRALHWMDFKLAKILPNRIVLVLERK